MKGYVNWGMCIILTLGDGSLNRVVRVICTVVVKDSSLLHLFTEGSMLPNQYEERGCPTVLGGVQWRKRRGTYQGIPCKYYFNKSGLMIIYSVYHVIWWWILLILEPVAHKFYKSDWQSVEEI